MYTDFLHASDYVLYGFEKKITDEQAWQLCVPALFDVGHMIHLA